jgi:hypothetical protein
MPVRVQHFPNVRLSLRVEFPAAVSHGERIGDEVFVGKEPLAVEPFGINLDCRPCQDGLSRNVYITSF